MNTFLKLSIFYLLVIVLAVGVVLNIFYADIKPSISKSREDSMVDNANLLAEFIVPYFQEDKTDLSKLQAIHDLFKRREPNAKIWSYYKQKTNLEFYITDAQGIVLFHSANPALVGADYSQWHDVIWTLRGEYGARTTLADPNNALSGETHVAAPILLNGEIRGVLTLIQPHLDAEPFVGNGEKKVFLIGGLLLAALVIIGIFLALWYNQMLSKLTNYVAQVRKGEEVEKLHFSDPAFNAFAETLHKMREELDGKDYIEKYIHTLTHELKTPLSAISAAAQILETEITADKRNLFLQNIEAEVQRLKNLIERLLLLASIENQPKPQFKTVNIETLVSEEIVALTPLLAQKSIRVIINKPEVLNPEISGDDFLLRMAIRNLLDNAIDFSHKNSELTVQLLSDARQFKVTILNQGELIPTYAFQHLFDKFFSRPRQTTGRKSSGLGLCLVKEIAHLHNGDIKLTNVTAYDSQGVQAEMSFNLSKKIKQEVIEPNQNPS